MRDWMLPEQLYFKVGQRAILLLHAYTGSPNDVRMLARRLERAGYTVYAPMFSGHGTENPMDILKETADKWWRDAQDAVQFLQEEGFDEIAVFGLSMGGMYAMRLLGEYPEWFVGGGAFSSPLVPDQAHNIYPNFLKYCEFMFKKMPLTDYERVTKLESVKAPLSTQLAGINQSTKRVHESLPSIKLPVFLAQSGLDEMVQADLVYDAGKALAQSKHQINWYPKSTHVITVSKERQLFEQDVLGFVEHLSWQKK